ncbi:hypothetical protein ABT354_31010 [Streptomyces sp. NPDC000594]|uniref:hypothetical protein n=1 Tax=Streptomyces sp. NPDC000594 TaxID=3154261 RepID=UPI00332C5745
MRLLVDGTTPVPKSVLVDHLEMDAGYVFELVEPLVLFAGDRIGFEATALVITRADGARLTHAGHWATRC